MVHRRRGHHPPHLPSRDSGDERRFPRGDDDGARELEMDQLAEEFGDSSRFESRHSEPRDPIEGGSELGEEQREGMDEIDQDRISHLRYAPASPQGGHEHSRVLSFTGVGAHPLSTSWRVGRGREGVYRRRVKADKGKGEEGELDSAEYISPPIPHSQE